MRPAADGSGTVRERVLITGAASGLGLGFVQWYAAAGAQVLATDVAHVVPAGVLPVGVEYRRLDVTSDEDWTVARDWVTETWGGLDVLYNNAGVSPGDDDTPLNTSEETWDFTFDVNVKGLFLCCRYGIQAMLDSGGGSIVNVASFVAHMGAATPQVAYTSSKGAVLAMTQEIAAIYARQGIRANSLCPGPVLTPLLAKFLSDEEKRQRRLVHIPMGRFGEAEEMVNGALFLASDVHDRPVAAHRRRHHQDLHHAALGAHDDHDRPTP